MREPHADLVEHVEDRVPAVGEVGVARVDHRLRHRREHRHGLPDPRPGEADDGVARRALAAARAVAFISSAARRRTPSGSPSPQTRAGRMPRCRSSIGSSQTAWPARWLEIAHTLEAVLVQDRRSRPRDVGVVLGRAARRRGGRPSRRSPGRRSPTRDASRATSSNGRSAHWPVNSVTGRGIVSSSFARLAVGSLAVPPAARRPRPTLDGGQHLLHLQAVGERRRRVAARGDVARAGRRTSWVNVCS